MRITFKDSKTQPAKSDLLAVFAFEGSAPVWPSGVAPGPEAKAFGAGARKTRHVATNMGRALIVGLGPAKTFDAEGLRRAAAVAVKAARSDEAAGLTIWCDAAVAEALGAAEAAGQALAEGARMALYTYVEFKKEKQPDKLAAIALQGPGAAFKKGGEHGLLLAESNLYTRDLQNAPGNRMRPRDMAAAAQALAKRSSQIQCRVLDEKAMAQLKMGALLGVSAGSSEPARLIHLVYKPKRKAKRKVALVGKGLTFDSGGISLKPGAKMWDMKYDMSGGAAVLGVFHALADIDVACEVHGIVPSSENMPDAGAQKPGDVVTAMDGQTIEVLNTDAEGTPDPVRRPVLRAHEGQAGHDHRPGHADRRGGHRARARAQRHVRLDREPARRPDARGSGDRRARLAAAVDGLPQGADEGRGRRPAQHQHAQSRQRLDLGRGLPRALRRGHRVVPPRHRGHGLGHARARLRGRGPGHRRRDAAAGALLAEPRVMRAAPAARFPGRGGVPRAGTKPGRAVPCGGALPRLLRSKGPRGDATVPAGPIASRGRPAGGQDESHVSVQDQDKTFVPGLAGVPACESRVGYIDGQAGILEYRGFRIEVLAEKSNFEEVTWLLWEGDLPTRAELASFRAELRAARKLPSGLIDIVRSFPREAHPMAAFQAAMAGLGMFFPNPDFKNARESREACLRILAAAPVVVAAFERLRSGRQVVAPDPELDSAANFLWMVNGQKPDEISARTLDCALVLHAEHTLNASTFAARVVASTEADPYTVVASALGALYGALHGGANERVLEQLRSIGGPDKVKAWLDQKFAVKAKVMGFGHRVYKVKDPRAHTLQGLVRQVFERHGSTPIYDTALEIEKQMAERVGAKGIAPNVDFFSGIVYEKLGIPIDGFTPVFGIARIAGYLAHWREQMADNKLFRPGQIYLGEHDRPWVPIAERG